MLKTNIIKILFIVVLGIGTSFCLATESDTTEREGVSIPIEQKEVVQQPFLRSNSLLKEVVTEVTTTEIIEKTIVKNSPQQKVRLSNNQLMAMWGISLTTASFCMLPTIVAYITSFFPNHSVSSEPTFDINDMFTKFCLQTRYVGRDLIESDKWCEMIRKSCGCELRNGFPLYHLERNTSSCNPDKMFADAQKEAPNPFYNHVSYAALFRDIAHAFDETVSSDLMPIQLFKQHLHDIFTMYCNKKLSFLRAGITSNFMGSDIYITSNQTHQSIQSAPFCLKQECVTQYFPNVSNMLTYYNLSHSQTPEHHGYFNTFVPMMFVAWGIYFMSFFFI